MLEDPEDALPPLADGTIYAFCRNVVVAASAGTGKTYRLTALYVLLALGFTSMGEVDDRTAAPPVGPERIVATTFSRAAAAEIASRVERALRELAAWDGRASLIFGPVLEARAAALGFGDLLRMARDALRDRPEIGRAVREEIDALLVDELQDTSRVQRDLVYLLRERDDAAERRGLVSDTDPSPFPRREAPSAEGLAPHGLFLVGDRKQSIYGFRGADVAVFSRMAAELCGRAAAVALALPEGAAPEGPARASFVALRESRRSGAAILDFVNAFAERDFTGDRAAGTAPRAFEIAYGPAEHLVPCASPAPPEARVVFVPDDGTSPEGAEPIVRESSGAAVALTRARRTLALVGSAAPPRPASTRAPPNPPRARSRSTPRISRCTATARGATGCNAFSASRSPPARRRSTSSPGPPRPRPPPPSRLPSPTTPRSTLARSIGRPIA